MRLVVGLAAVLITLLATSPALSAEHSQTGVVLVHQYQRYAGEEGLGVGFGSLWVSGADNSESVVRESLTTSTSISIAASSDEDTTVGIGPTAVWMTDFAGGVARRIDPSTNRVASSTKGLAGASGLAFSGSDVWVAVHHEQAVAELDGSTGRVIGLIHVPSPGGGVTASGPSVVAVGLGSVWTDVPNIGAVVRLDPVVHKTVAVIHDGASCCGDVVVVDGTVWTTTDGTVDRIDPKTDTVTMHIHLANGLLARGPALGGRLWVAAGDSIVEIDPRTGRVLSRTRFAKAFFKDLASGDGALWAWDATTNQVDELHPA